MAELELADYGHIAHFATPFGQRRATQEGGQGALAAKGTWIVSNPPLSEDSGLPGPL